MKLTKEYKLIGGEMHKLCAGPAHEKPTFLPATEKYFYKYKSGTRAGRFVSRCRLCNLWGKVKVRHEDHGLVPVTEARPFFLEAANRIGAEQLSLRTGLSLQTISDVLLSRKQHVRRFTLRLVMVELVSIRRKKEYSISNHAKWRIAARANGYGPRCRRCGCDTNNYTEGCPGCWERKSSREYRQKSSG
jgi:hypothetical protein